MQNRGEPIDNPSSTNSNQRTYGEEVNMNQGSNNNNNTKSVVTLVFMALEAYANKCKLETDPNFQVSNCYSNNSLELKKTKVQLQYQIISQLTILKYSFQFENKDQLSKTINIEQEIKRLKTWCSWVPDEDKKYYIAAIELLYGRNIESFDSDFNKDKPQKPKKNVGEEVEEPQRDENGVPYINLSTIQRLRKVPVIEEREGSNRYVNPQEQEKANNKPGLRELVDSFFDAFLLNLENLQSYLPSDDESADLLWTFFDNSSVFAESVEQYIKTYDLYLYKEDKNLTALKIKSFTSICQTLLETGYDVDFFKRIKTIMDTLIF
jgi:hypothetical protein